MVPTIMTQIGASLITGRRISYETAPRTKQQYYHSGYYAMKKYLRKKENRCQINHSFGGIEIASELALFVGRERHVTIPEKPNLFQKMIAFALVQTMICNFARTKNKYIDYAYSWLNAKEIFQW